MIATVVAQLFMGNASASTYQRAMTSAAESG
jgi:hypothetical protein